MPRTLYALPLLLILLPTAISAQQQSLPGCEANAALQKIVKDQLHSPEFDRLSYADQLERKRQVLSRLMTRYPRQVEPYNLWIEAVREDQLAHPELLTNLQQDYKSRASQRRDDPLTLYIASAALYQTDTPESIRLLEHAQTLAPSFPWPAMKLAQIYSEGKFADTAKFNDQLTRFWTACPASQDRPARWMLVKNPELQAKVASALRPILAESTDPDRLKDYEFLWGLEFRTTPPTKFPALRQQVAADVKRLESIKNPHPDADWASLLLQGDKQAGATHETIRAREDVILASYPHSSNAQGIVWSRWQKDHPMPTDQKDAAAWKTYKDALRTLQLTSNNQYPDETFPPDIYRYFALSNDDNLLESEGIDLIYKYVNAEMTYWPPSFYENANSSAAGDLLEHKWAPDRALGYILQAKQWREREELQDRAQDNHSESDLKDLSRDEKNASRYLDSQLLLAAMRAKRPDAITPAMKASIEAPRAADDKDESAYWLRRARLADIEGRQQDALGYYQIALRTRPRPPSYERGKLTDNVAEEAQALWTKLGGTEVAWAAWSAPMATPNAAKADDARWEKPTKALPTFELADLSGKTWSAKSLNGKVVLINLWATWCGPCNAELPQLQKLYEQARGRSDLQILTFNIDEDLGLVEPFMKEKGYTFPVVPAYSYVVNLLNGYAIPQNWVLSPKGDWDWTQVGYGSDDAWVKDMLAKLDAVKAGG